MTKHITSKENITVNNTNKHQTYEPQLSAVTDRFSDDGDGLCDLSDLGENVNNGRTLQDTAGNVQSSVTILEGQQQQSH